MRIKKRLPFSIIAILVLTFNSCEPLFATDYTSQINALKEEITTYQNESARLQSEANTLQNELSALSVQKSQLQAQIDLNTAQVAQLEQEIAETQEEINYQKDLLANNLVNLYVDNTVSPLEMLASSDNISEYIDKQEYREAIRSSLQDSIAEVKDLEQQLNDQKTETERALADQQAQKEQLTATEEEQSLLLAQTQGQEEAYQQLTADKEAELTAAYAAQAEEMRRLASGSIYTGGTGGYPWAGVGGSVSTYYHCFGYDNWGMCIRQCVSYAAWKVYATRGYMYYWGGHGNAYLWPSNARAEGIAVDSTPQVGDIAYWPVGTYGHVMYVEKVNGSSIEISEYNYVPGEYSYRVVNNYSSLGYQFIHF